MHEHEEADLKRTVWMLVRWSRVPDLSGSLVAPMHFGRGTGRFDRSKGFNCFCRYAALLLGLPTNHPFPTR